jgi:hypothetical protein
MSEQPFLNPAGFKLNPAGFDLNPALPAAETLATGVSHSIDIHIFRRYSRVSYLVQCDIILVTFCYIYRRACADVQK